jgi:hypothetical protein
LYACAILGQDVLYKIMHILFIGVNVKITTFGDFYQYSATKLPIFMKNYANINVSCINSCTCGKKHFRNYSIGPMQKCSH